LWRIESVRIYYHDWSS